MVSWDANVKKIGSNELKDLLQPVLKNEQSPPKQVVKKEITVTDLHAINPLELEAETFLMKAIEQQAIKEKHRGSTAVNQLFAHIPDKGLMEALQADSPPGLLGGSNEGGNSLSPKMHRRKKLKPFAVPPDMNASLESMLFSLTAAMKEMHTTNDDKKMQVLNHHCLPHEAHKEAFEAPSDDEPASNADSMVCHAAFLFQNPLQKNKLQGKSNDLEEKTLLKTSSHSHQSCLSVASGIDDSRQSGGNHLDRVPKEVEYSCEDSDPEIGDITTQNSLNECKDDSLNKKKRKGLGGRMLKRMKCFTRRTQSDWAAFSDFLQPRKASFSTHVKIAVLFFVIPMLSLAAILFHLFGNPDLGCEGASISWFLLFLLRQSITGGLAYCTIIL